MIKRNNIIYILSPAIGIAGGADKATKLLAEAYRNLKFDVKVFATSCEVQTNSDEINIKPPYLNYGHRWRIPQISLIIKLLFNCWINKPRYIHCIGLTFEIKLALKFLKKYKLVVWETTEANKENRFVYHGIIPYLKHAIMILAPSQTIKQNILTNYQYSGIINILPFWTDWLPKIYVTDKKRTGHLLYVGRLDIDKGFDCLFNALRQLNNKFNLHIDICGRGNIDSIKKLAYNLEKVTFHGFANNNKLVNLYNNADFVILPSKHEGYPLSLIEACGYSVPIIATKVGSIPEVFGKSKAALLFNTSSESDLINCLNIAYSENDQEYHSRRKSSRDLFEKINSLNQIEQSLLNIGKFNL